MEDEDIGAFSTHALTVICFLEPVGLKLCLSFDDRLVAESEAQRMARQMEHAVRQLCTAELDRTRLRDVGMAGPDDVQQLWTWNAVVPETVLSCVQDLIGAVAAARPDVLAVEGWDGQFTYAELLRTATRLASYLQSRRIGPEVMVPTCFEKSVWAAVSMLAVIFAGGVGVSVDVSQPEERLRAIISQTGACIVLDSSQTADLARRIAPDVVSAFQELAPVIPEQGLLSPDRAPTPDNALFITFTSGSTGTPKGAIITYAGCSSAIHHQQEAFGMTTSTRVLDFASYAFDVAWFNLLYTLAAGAALCIPSDHARRDNLVATIRQFNANYLFLTPSLGRHLDSACAPSIKDLIMGGEAVGRGDMAGWADDVRVRVAYGPAECTIMSNIAVLPANRLPRVVHTGPGRGVICWIVSSENPELLAPLGAIGELVLEGPLLGRGYLGEPGKTSAAFGEDPPWLLSGGGPGFPGRAGRIYRTGDLARFTDDGGIVIVGRKDGACALDK
jgi:amino acid adenylation domain-containing protein